MSNPALHLMRKVEDLDQLTVDYLVAEGTRLRKFPDQERLKMGNPQPYNHALGLVDNNWARDEWVTLELMEATTGFAIYDNSGNVLAEFGPDELHDAEIAYSRSKISIQVDFSVGEPDKPAKSFKKLAAAVA